MPWYAFHLFHILEIALTGFIRQAWLTPQKTALQGSSEQAQTAQSVCVSQDITLLALTVSRACLATCALVGPWFDARSTITSQPHRPQAASNAGPQGTQTVSSGVPAEDSSFNSAIRRYPRPKPKIWQAYASSAASASGVTRPTTSRAW